MNFRRPAEGDCVAGKSREKNQGRVGERIVRLRDMQAAASIALLLMSGWTQRGMTQQRTNRNRPTNPSTNPQTSPAPQTNPPAPAPPQPVQNDSTGQAGLPQGQATRLTEPLYLWDTPIDYSKPKSHLW